MDTHDIDRRQFFHALVRTCLLGGLTFAGGLLVWRRLKEGECADPRACQACRAYAACPLRQQHDEAQS